MNTSGLTACGILGGTFDPVHLGHIALAEAALAKLPLAEVLWLPSGSPGHRDSPVARARDRLAMLKLAIAGGARYRIDDGELGRSEPTYTVNSLTRLRAGVGTSQPLVLILGSDSFLSLPTWLRWRDLLVLAHIAVASRPGHPLGESGTEPDLAAEITRRAAAPAQLAASAAGKIVSFDMPPTDISSSAIRSALDAGQDTHHLLPAAVLAYIQSQHLYPRKR